MQASTPEKSALAPKVKELPFDDRCAEDTVSASDPLLNVNETESVAVSNTRIRSSHFIAPIVCGILIRVILFLCVGEYVIDSVEFNAPQVSFKHLTHALSGFLGHGDIHTTSHIAPFVLSVYSFIVKHSSKVTMLMFNIGCDVITALMLAGMATQLADKARALHAVKIFMLGPLSVACCIALTLTPLYNMCLMLIVYSFTNGMGTLCASAIGMSATLQLYPITLLVPLLVSLRGRAAKIVAFIMFVFMVFTLIAMNYAISGSLTYLKDVYGYLVYMEGLDRNTGLFWYFCVQVFENYRGLYIIAFQANAFIYAIPLAFKLREAPFLHLLVSILLLSVFSPYPHLGDSALFFALLPFVSEKLKVMKYLLVTMCALVTCFTLSPVMTYIWIEIGGGNANYFFASTLLFNVALVYIVIDLLGAHLRGEVVHHCAAAIKPSTVFVVN